jgi:sugar lactone lactonase YvrE
LNTNREIEGEVPMMWRRLFPLDVIGTRSARPQPAVRGRDLRATRRREQPRVEALEGRQLLAALTEFPLSSNQTAGAALTAGPDGNLWFPVQEGAGEIARITPAGVLTTFPLPANYSKPSALTVGPDNNLWFTDLFNKSNQTTVPAVVQITPAGAITEFQTQSNYASASALTVGPDNNLWFTESTPSSSGVPAASVGRATTAGVITEFLLPSTSNVVSALTDGLDGNLWFAASTTPNSGASSSIGRITPGGTVSEFALPSTYFGASALTTDPDGNLWFSNQTNSPPTSSVGNAAIARITQAGTVSEYPLSSSVNSASTLTVGPDGNLWFSEQGYFTFGSAQIGQITPAGAVKEFPLAPGFSLYSPSGSTSTTSALTVGPDKALYFTFVYNSYYNPLASTGTPGAVTIGRVTTSGNVIEFTGTVPASNSGSYSAYAPTVGSDGNLWFPDGSNIGRLDRALATLDQALPPGVTTAYANRPKNAITAIVVKFDEAMNSASAGTKSFYGVAAGVKKHHMLVYTKPVKIRSVTYDPSAGTATLKLASPFKGNQLQVTVHSGVMAANGTSTVGGTTTFAS